MWISKEEYMGLLKRNAELGEKLSAATVELLACKPPPTLNTYEVIASGRPHTVKAEYYGWFGYGSTRSLFYIGKESVAEFTNTESIVKQ